MIKDFLGFLILWIKDRKDMFQSMLLGREIIQLVSDTIGLANFSKI